MTLQGGILKDQAGRTGYIASNRQFQFDNPVQAGAISQSGWSVCSNNSLALAGSAIFYQCLSGSFYNLYDRSQGGQCAAIYIETLTGSNMAAPSGAQSVSAISDGQPQASTAKVTQISDDKSFAMILERLADPLNARSKLQLLSQLSLKFQMDKFKPALESQSQLQSLKSQMDRSKQPNQLLLQ